MADIKLQIKNVSVQTGSNQQAVLKKVSFDIPVGMITGIAGESGSGKSMTALSIMGLLPKNLTLSEGEILFNDDDQIINLSALNKYEINDFRGKKISMIFQEPMSSLNPSMTCGHQLDEVLKKHSGLNYAERLNRILALFEEVRLPGIKEMYKSYPHQLSGGQRQRVMIAMALVAEPSLIIADEPTTALDVRVQKSIISLLRDLQASRKLTIIFISHDLRLMKELADRIIIMRKGEVIENNNSKAFFKNPGEAYSKGLLACIPPLDRRPERLLTIEDYENGLSSSPENSTPSKPDKKEVILSVRNLEVHFTQPVHWFSTTGKTLKAVNKVSFEVFKGETLGLVGESGCGKTSLGKALLKLIEAKEGEIYYKEQLINHLKANKLKQFRRNVQVVFQDPYATLNPRMSVEQTLNEVLKVHFPGKNRNQRLERIIQLLEITRLKETDLKKYPHQFSGGQRQRIGIARALAVEPELLILDESVSALDVSVQAQILNLLNQLKKDLGLSYIFISHDLAVVKYMSDRILIMKDGKIIESGDSDEIYRNPVNEYSQELISSLPGI
jgi:peptide/nickel transport system ATP-binding protein